ncbi:MAG: tripartite tricarboxylate transporter substrate binding protein [Rhodopseudomonas sp.]|nr:tripartite tricarboxylate transporter substrate binding protein [Rhodopseudomonas sp.]
MIRIVLGILLAFVVTAQAEEAYPSRNITIVVPYAAGTAPDFVARQFGDALSHRLGRAVVVESKLGAGGLLGTQYAASQKPDGYTLFLGSKDTNAVLGHLYTRLNFDPNKALTPISLLATIDNAIVVGPGLGINSLKEMIDAAHKGRKLTFASPGIGTNLHLLGELVSERENLKLTHVPYRAFPTAFQDVMTGRVDMVVSGVPPIVGMLATKKLKALAVTGPKRVAALPDVPTMKELGYDDLTFVGWFGLFAPAGTPQAIVDKLSTAAKEISRDAGYRAKLEKIYMTPVGDSVADFKVLIDKDSARMGDLIKKVGIKIEQ